MTHIAVRSYFIFSFTGSLGWFFRLGYSLVRQP